MRKTEIVTCGGRRYRIEVFGAKQNTGIFARLRNMGVFFGVQEFLKGTIKVPPDDMIAMADDLLTCTEYGEMVVPGKEIWTKLAPEWDEHFAGGKGFAALLELLMQIVNFNFDNFLDVGTPSPASPPPVPPSKSDSSGASTG